MIMRFSEDDGELIANFFFLGHAQIKSNISSPCCQADLNPTVSGDFLCKQSNFF